MELPHDLMGTDENVDLNSLSEEELKEFIRINKDTKSALQEEITLLKKQINQFGIDLVPPKGFQTFTRPDGTSNLESVRVKLAEEIQLCTNRLEKTSQLTDITINKVEREVTEMDGRQCKKMFSVDLEMLDRKVQLKYEVQESLMDDEDDDTASSRICWFEVSFDGLINDAIGNEITQAAEKTAIHSVFSLLKTFLQWQRTQERLVQHFMDKYPDNVEAETNANGLLTLQLFVKPGHPVFVLEWDRKTVDSRIEPDLRLRVTAPQQMLEMDKNKILETAPEAFACMLSSYGQEKAIDNFISLLNRNRQNTAETSRLS